MLATTLTLADAAAANKSFVQNKLDSTGSDRIDTTTTLAAPRLMSIRHTTTGKGATAVDRHLIQFVHNEVDSNGVPVAVVVNTTVQVPRSSTISRAEIDDLLAFTKNFLAVTANVDAILRNEA